MSSSTMIMSLSHARVLWSVTEIVTESAVLRGSPVDDWGRNTFTPPVLFSDSVKSTNVASRKKMTSIRGMISMRAFLAMMDSDYGTCGRQNRRRSRLAAEWGRGFGLLDQDFQR